VRDQVSHPYKTTGRIMVLYILTFTSWTAGRMTKEFPEFLAYICLFIINPYKTDIILEKRYHFNIIMCGDECKDLSWHNTANQFYFNLLYYTIKLTKK
jgi:hypothetical protein